MTINHGEAAAAAPFTIVDHVPVVLFCRDVVGSSMPQFARLFLAVGGFGLSNFFRAMSREIGIIIRECDQRPLIKPGRRDFDDR